MVDREPTKMAVHIGYRIPYPACSAKTGHFVTSAYAEIRTSAVATRPAVKTSCQGVKAAAVTRKSRKFT